MKIIINENYLWHFIVSIFMFINYLVEISLWYAVYLLINHWQVTGQETIGWIIDVGILIFVRMVIPMTIEESFNYDLRAKRFNFHWYHLWRTGMTVKYLISKVPISFELK